MCLLILNEKTGKGGIPKKTLELGANRNKDGGGVAWIEDGIVHWKKGIKTVDEIYEIIQEKEGPHIVHFRLSTVGGDNPNLCHPFPVTADCSTELEGVAPAVVAHNGHWSDWQKCVIALLNRDNILPEGPWSDTRGIAWTTFHHGEGVLDVIGEKVGLLTPQGVTAYGRGWYRDNFNDVLLSYNPYESSCTGGYWSGEGDAWEYKNNNVVVHKGGCE